MSSDKIHLMSPQFLRYQAEYEKNPKSRVFAPLAEMYRKVGMVEKAMEILANGIRFNRDYLMGYVGLGFCYYDIRQYKLSYDTIKPYIDQNRDNLRLQKLFVDTCIALNFFEEGLATCKYLVFINPKDKEISDKLIFLEREVENLYRHEHKPIVISKEDSPKNQIDERSNESFSADDDFDSWKPLDFTSKSIDQNSNELFKDDELDNWNIKRNETKLDKKSLNELLEFDEEDNNFNIEKSVNEDVEDNSLSSDEDLEFKVDVEKKVNPIIFVSMEEEYREEAPVSINETSPEIHAEKKLDVDHQFEDKSDNDEINSNVIEIQKNKKKESPIVTHTLVDLYCGQGYFTKALDVLDKILVLNPDDQKSIQKREEILDIINGVEDTKASLNKNLKKESTESLEDEGRKSLMDLIDEKVGSINLDLINESEDDDEAQECTEVPNLNNSTLGNQMMENLVQLSKHPELSNNKDYGALIQQNSKTSSIKELKIDKLNKFLSEIKKRALDNQSRF